VVGAAATSTLRHADRHPASPVDDANQPGKAMSRTERMAHETVAEWDILQLVLVMPDAVLLTKDMWDLSVPHGKAPGPHCRPIASHAHKGPAQAAASASRREDLLFSRVIDTPGHAQGRVCTWRGRHSPPWPRCWTRPVSRPSIHSWFSSSNHWATVGRSSDSGSVHSCQQTARICPWPSNWVTTG